LYEAIDVLSQDGYTSTVFYGGTQNISDYNLDETDTAWFEVDLIPLTRFEMKFADETYDSYDAVLIGQRPGIGVDGIDEGVHVCRIQAAKRGESFVNPNTANWEPNGCNPVGEYKYQNDCRKYRTDIGVFDETAVIKDLGNGFYSSTSVSDRGGEQLTVKNILTEDPTKPGFLTGGTYYRSDFEAGRGYDTAKFPIYHTVQVQMIDENNDNTCDTWTSSLQAYRPGAMPEDDEEGDVVHFCRGTGEENQVDVASLVDWLAAIPSSSTGTLCPRSSLAITAGSAVVIAATVVFSSSIGML